MTSSGTPGRPPRDPAQIVLTRGTPRQRLYLALRQGATLPAAAAMAHVPQPLAEIMVDEMQRQGLLMNAESLCASGLGACHGGTSDEVRIHCAGCPIL